MSKVIIKIGNNAIEFEGSEDFIRDDLLTLVERLSAGALQFSADVEDADENPIGNGQAKKIKQKRQTSGSVEGSKAAEYKPKLNPNLNLASLEAFYDKYDLKKHPDKILVFSIFLRDTLKMTTIGGDDIFSCYFAMKDKTKIPEAFAKALRDARKLGYIDFNEVSSLSVTITGQNAFQKLKMAGANK